MPSDTEGRLDRLERAVQHGLNVDINEFNDPEQAKAYAARLEADQKDEQKQLEKAAKAEADAAAEPAGKEA